MVGPLNGLTMVNSTSVVAEPLTARRLARAALSATLSPLRVAMAIGLADRRVADSEALSTAQALARSVAAFPKICLRADRASALTQWMLLLQEALVREGRGGAAPLCEEAGAGAALSNAGAGRAGRFDAHEDFWMSRIPPPAEMRRISLHHHLSRGEIHQVRRRSTWREIGMIVHCWAVIAAAMVLAAWLPNPLTILVAIMVIGSRQLGLAILMHEGAHGGLASNQKLNLLLSQWLCAYPVLAETLVYRRYHLEHHAHAQTAKDPDIELSAPFPTSRASIRRKLARDLSGQTGYKQRKAQFKAALGCADEGASIRLRRFRSKLGRQLLVNVFLFGVLALAGQWWLYPFLWVLPMLTWYQAVTRIRNIAEHAVLPHSDPWRVARTTRAGLLARTFLAPYHVNYHAEHHFMLYVPCYRLPYLHRLLVSKGLEPKLELQPSYLATMRLAAPAG